MDERHACYSDPGYVYGGGMHQRPADPSCCRWRVFRGFYSGQCHRKAKVDGLWCHQHSPAAMAKKAREDEARMDAYLNDLESQQAEQDLRAVALEALREIAKGELNDPVGYAQLVLDGQIT